MRGTSHVAALDPTRKDREEARLPEGDSDRSELVSTRPEEFDKKPRSGHSAELKAERDTLKKAVDSMEKAPARPLK